MKKKIKNKKKTKNKKWKYRNFGKQNGNIETSENKMEISKLRKQKNMIHINTTIQTYTFTNIVMYVHVLVYLHVPNVLFFCFFLSMFFILGN